MKKLILLALMFGMLSPMEAKALCFTNSIPGPCNERDKTVRVVQNATGSTTFYGMDRFTGNPWKMTMRYAGDNTVYNGEANGRSWHIVQHSLGNQSNYSGVDANGKRFSYNCSITRCSSYRNPTSITTGEWEAKPIRQPEAPAKVTVYKPGVIQSVSSAIISTLP